MAQEVQDVDIIGLNTISLLRHSALLERDLHDIRTGGGGAKGAPNHKEGGLLGRLRSFE
jgi:hypothetical protein